MENRFFETKSFWSQYRVSIAANIYDGRASLTLFREYEDNRKRIKGVEVELKDLASSLDKLSEDDFIQWACSKLRIRRYSQN